MFSDVFGEGGDAGVSKKSSTWTLLLLHSIKSTHTGRRKGGDFKNYFPTKKLYNLEIRAWEFKAITSFSFTLSQTAWLWSHKYFLLPYNSQHFFFHCSCKICNSTVIEALCFEGRGGGGTGESVRFEALCSRGCHPSSSLAYLLSLLKGTKRTVKTSSAARQHLLQIPWK